MPKPNPPGASPPLPFAKIALPGEPAKPQRPGAGHAKTLAGVPLPSPSGPLSATTVALVQSSWAKVLPISDAAAALFYDRLFELDPSVRPLFKSDMAAQKKKLMQTLSVAVDGLSNPPRLVPALESLGARHAGYMVEDRHYDLVGQALLWTLREGLGDDFTADVEAAWSEVYAVIAEVMKKAGAGAQPPGRAEPKPAAAPGPAARAELTPPAAPLPRAQDADEDNEATLHFSPPPDVAAPAPARAATAAPAAAPSPVAAPAPLAAPAPIAAPAPATLFGAATISSSAPSSLTLALPDRDLTLNVRVQLDGLPAPAPAAAPAPAPAPAPGMAPGLLLAGVCVAASMAAPLLGARADVPTYGVPLTILVLTAAAFGLGFLWGRGRGAGG